MKSIFNVAVLACGIIGSTTFASQEQSQRQRIIEQLSEKYTGLREVKYQEIFTITENKSSNNKITYRVEFKKNPYNFSIYLDGGVRILARYLSWRGVSLPEYNNSESIVLTGDDAARIHDLLGEIERAILFFC